MSARPTSFAPHDAAPAPRAGELIGPGAVAYGAAVAIGLPLLRYLPAPYPDLAEWVAVPAQLLAIVLCAGRAYRSRTAPRPTAVAWLLVLAFAVLSLTGTLLWNVSRPRGLGPVFSLADLVYLTDYWLMAAAYAALIVQFGGSLRSARLWLDAASVFIALLAAFWAVLYAPLAPRAGAGHIPAVFSLSYALTLAGLMSMAAVLWIRVPGVRSHRAIVLLIVAGIVDVAWEIGWLAGWMTNVDFVGPYYDFGDVLCFVLIACAALDAPRPASRAPETVSLDRSAYTFVPTLATLLSIALIAASLASTRASDAWVLVALVLLCAVLLVTRQRAVRAELATLNHALAVRAADARLTELVRASADLFMVVDADATIVFASPAAEQIVGIPADRLLRSSALDLLGAAHRPQLERFLASLLAPGRGRDALEVALAGSGDAPRVLKIAGANKLANPAIGGITLTVTDMTEHRALEREVLTAANQERLRLASDIHDGLGQELTGIALMLEGAAKARGAEAAGQREQLRPILAQLSQTIGSARNLARGLSPLYVVGGSLRDALQRLGEDPAILRPVTVAVDARLDHRGIDDFSADHLYRIAREAVHNSVKHSGARCIEVSLTVSGPDLVLTIVDDGTAKPSDGSLSPGLGMRLMGYRARVIGGTLTVDRRPGAGLRVRVTAPLHNVAARPA